MLRLWCPLRCPVIIFIGIFLIYTALIRLGWYSILRMDKGSLRFLRVCFNTLRDLLPDCLSPCFAKQRPVSRLYSNGLRVFSLLPFSSVCRSDHAPPIPSNGFPRSSQLSYIRFCCGFPPKVATCALSECCCALCWTSCPWLSSLYGLNGKPFYIVLAHQLRHFFQCRPLMRIAGASGSSAFYTACYIFKGPYLPYTVINRLAFGFSGNVGTNISAVRFPLFTDSPSVLSGSTACCSVAADSCAAGSSCFFRNCPTFCKTNRQIAESIIWWRAMHKTILNAWLCLPCEFLRIRTSHKLFIQCVDTGKCMMPFYRVIRAYFPFKQGTQTHFVYRNVVMSFNQCSQVLI